MESKSTVSIGIKRTFFHQELRKLREDLGLSQQEVADKCNFSISIYSLIETFKRYPNDEQITAMISVLGNSVENLFPDWSKPIYKDRKVNKEIITISRREFDSPEVKLLEAPEQLDNMVIEEIDKDELKRQLNSLNPREKKIIEMRFGLYNQEPKTLEEVGKEFKVTRERIREIESKAIQKLKHPTRSRPLSILNYLYKSY